MRQKTKYHGPAQLNIVQMNTMIQFIVQQNSPQIIYLMELQSMQHHLYSYIEVSELITDHLRDFENSKKSHEANKIRYNLNRNPIQYEVGELINVENSNKLNHHKLDKIRIGAFPIVTKLSNIVFELKVGNKDKAKRLYHIKNKIVKFPQIVYFPKKPNSV